MSPQVPLIATLRSIILFSVLKHERLAKISMKAFERTMDIPRLKRFALWTAKMTVFEQFCAPEGRASLLKLTRRLESENVYPAFDFVAEADASNATEAAFDENFQNTLESVRIACDISSKPMVASKLSAFGDLEAMESVSQWLRIANYIVWTLQVDSPGEFDTPFGDFPMSECIEDSGSGLRNYSLEHIKNRLNTSAGDILEGMNVPSTEAFSDFEKKYGSFDLHAMSLAVLDLASGRLYLESPAAAGFVVPWLNQGLSYCRNKLNTGETLLLKDPSLAVADGLASQIGPLVDRVDGLCTLIEKKAKECEAKGIDSPFVLFDAEFWTSQPIMDALVRRAGLGMNSAVPLIANTYQQYLRDGAERCRVDVAAYRGRKAPTGVKIVRGAYRTFETELARSQNRPDPIQPGRSATHDSYNGLIHELVDLAAEARGKLFFGTHNSKSIDLILDEVSRSSKLINPSDVIVAQLYGMRDNITEKAAACDKITAAKYLAYGPVDQSIAYLIRRVRENSEGAGMMGTERALYIRKLVEGVSQRVRRLN